MSQYPLLDKRILDSLSDGPKLMTRLNSGEVYSLCMLLGKLLDREPFRILDGRLQALRKAGKISFNSKTGWSLT